MDNSGFQAALDARVEDMLGACIKCGACFEACPITDAAGIGAADPKQVIAGVLDIVRMGEGGRERVLSRHSADFEAAKLARLFAPAGSVGRVGERP